jgi:hypothetical protein
MKIKQYIKYGLLVWAVCYMASCSKMDATYKDFLKGGEILYLGKVTAVKAYAGRNRIKIVWNLPKDPKVTGAIVYWNNKADSVKVTFPAPSLTDTLSVTINNLTEKTYAFDIYTFDNSGHRSLMVNAFANAYGDNYISTLYPRPVNMVAMVGSDGVVTWIGSSGESIGTELKYTDNTNALKQIFIPADSAKTTLIGFLPNSIFTYRSLYLPDTLCVDTFYSAYASQQIKGPRIDLSKTGWTATSYGDFDNRSGSSYRPPTYAIDNNPATAWVSKVVGSIGYPHTIYVDMGKVIQSIEGLSFMQRTPLSGALKLLEVQISQDTIANGWKPIGEFTLQNASGIQYIDFPKPESFRYFKVIGKSDYNNSLHIALAEVGVFKR